LGTPSAIQPSTQEPNKGQGFPKGLMIKATLGPPQRPSTQGQQNGWETQMHAQFQPLIMRPMEWNFEGMILKKGFSNLIQITTAHTQPRIFAK